MDHLYMLQFACFLTMVFNGFILGVTRLQVRWVNPRYEWARWQIFAGIMGLAAQYLMQMYHGFRAVDDGVGATVNALVYAPSFTLISMGIFHIEATHARRRTVYSVCAAINLAIFACFFIGFLQHGGMRIGAWLYPMLVLFAANVVYCIVVIVREIIKRRQLLETMAGGDIMPYVRYSRASLLILFFPALISPFVIISTQLLYYLAPLGLMAFLFFVLSFVALGYSYVPTEALLDADADTSPAVVVAQQEETKTKQAVPLHGDACHDAATLDSDKAKKQQTATLLPEDRKMQIQQRLDDWCAALGYKDGAVNLLSLSHTIHISKDDLTLFFDQCLNTTFRIWLSDIRFAAAKKMMIESPDYSNDIISSECGFSSRTHLYRIFKAREACTPTAWRERYLAEAHDSDASLS